MKPHTLFILLLLSFAAGQLAAQSTLLTGKVTDVRKRPMQGVSISLMDTYDGSTSDSAGTFRFLTTDTGRRTLQVSFTGFAPWEKDVELKGDTVFLEIVLKELPNELTAVVITAGSFEAGDAKRATVLKPLDIVTTASANADVAAAMRTLPGTQQVGESAELFVRGGEGYETRQFIDGMVVANPFFSSAPNIASRGRFSPFLFKGTVFSTGGYSALYGQALSSALVLESIDLPDRSEASASLSPLFAGGQYQHLARNKKSSWGVNAGYTNLALYFALVPQKPDYFRSPEVWNADANFRIKTSASGMIKFFVSYNVNKLGLRNPDIDMPDLKNAFGLKGDNLYTNISYRERLTNRLMLKTGAIFSVNNDHIRQELQDSADQPVTDGIPEYMKLKTYELNNRSMLAQVRALLDYKIGVLSAIRFGGEYWHSKDSSMYNNTFPNTLTDNFGALFAEGDIYITQSLAIRAGLRAEYSDLLARPNLAPRTSLAYKFSKKAQVSADYGIFYQKPISQYLLFNKRLPFMRADHYILTYQRMDAFTTFRAQVFHKEYKQLPQIDADTSAGGNGFARGFELFWRDKKSFRNFDYWLTYSWLDTKREYLNFPYAMRPSFAAEHTANLVVKRFFTKLNTQFNMNYQFATGRPYYNIRWNTDKQDFQVLDEGKTIAYNSMSLSVNYLKSVGKAFGVLVFSITNVLNSKQVFGYQYPHNGGEKVAIVPPARQFFFAGIFLSWGTDRTQDAINNNL